jgi:D-alanyl-D-alanine carboxypeptidase
LQHTAGLPDYGRLPEYHAAVAAGEEPWTEEELLRRVGPAELLFAPGTSWAYSNVGYLFVKEILERAGNAGLHEVIRVLVFGPVGAHRSFLATSVKHLDATAWGNERRYHPGWVYHGLAVGPPSEAALVLQAMLYTAFLPDHLKSELLRTVSVGGPFPGRPAVAPSYGLGVTIDSQSSLGRMVGHTGQGPGSTGAVYSFPDVTPPRTLSAFAPRDDADAAGALESHVLALAPWDPLAKP